MDLCLLSFCLIIFLSEQVCSAKEGDGAAEALRQLYLARDGWTSDKVEQLVTNTGVR